MINLVLALACEAKPLIKHFRLQKQHASHAYDYYHSDSICLIVSKPGKLAAAGATAWLAAQHPNTSSAWLNIGIAGHGYLPRGDGLLAHKIVDTASGTCWYPSMVFDAICNTANLHTLDAPSGDYHPDALYDMEAAGFYASASRFSCNELIQCYKIVSDNPDTDISSINAKNTTTLITEHLSIIENIINKLTALTQLITEPDASHYYQLFIQRWHFSQYQQHQLKNMLTRWHALQEETSPMLESLTTCNNANDVLTTLGQHLDQLPVNFKT